MARVLIDGDGLDIRFSLLERVMLAERSRKVPLSRVRGVDPHPPLLEMMSHWSDHGGVWLCGLSAYDGHMIPSSRNPGNTIAIELEGSERERIYVEIDDETSDHAAARIARALRNNQADTTETLMATTPASATEPHEAQADRMPALDVEIEDEDDDVQLRDPLMQGSLPPPPLRAEAADPAPEIKLDDDRDLTRLGGWLVALGSLGFLIGVIMLIGGALPGLLAVGAGVGCAALGGLAFAIVAHHQS